MAKHRMKSFRNRRFRYKPVHWKEVVIFVEQVNVLEGN